MWMHIRDVPGYLHDSVLYQTLDASDCDEELGIPLLYLKPDTSAQSINEFLHLMDTARYWGVHQLPKGVYEYIIDCNSANIEEIRACFEKFPEFSDYLQMLLELKTLPPHQRISCALFHKSCDAQVLQYLLGSGCAGCAAVTAANLSFIKSVREQTGSMLTIDLLLAHAVEEGQLSILKYLRERGYKWSGEVCAAAAKGGYLDCLQYAHENGCDWDSLTLHNAATNGHLACLKYVYGHGCTEWASEQHDTTSQIAANGHLDCLKYAHEHGCEWHPHTANRAFRYGQWTCMQYAIRNGLEPTDFMFLFAHTVGFVGLGSEIFYKDVLGYKSDGSVFVRLIPLLMVMVWPILLRLAIIWERIGYWSALFLWIVLSVLSFCLILIPHDHM